LRLLKTVCTIATYKTDSVNHIYLSLGFNGKCLGALREAVR